MTDNLLDALVEALERAGQHNSHDEASRVAVLWTDPDEQWRPLVGLLRPRVALLTLGRAGQYDPATLTGPAYYLRCLVARTLPGVVDGRVPVVYLPGVSRAALRVREECPREVLPLVELQYRGAFFMQKNGTDWTIPAFLQSEIGVTCRSDGATREALLRTLPLLAREPQARLRKEAPLRAESLDRLHYPDPTRAVLDWISDPDRFQGTATAEGWAAFRSLARAVHDLDPETDQAVTAARRLGERLGSWRSVWERFAERPEGWPGIAERLRVARPQTGLLDRVTAPDRWPQDNELAEERLRATLSDLTTDDPPSAREAVERLEAQHRARRESVWAKLGRAPLAMALRPLALIAQGTRKPLAGTTAEIAAAWTEGAWRVDLAVLDARAAVETPGDEAAVRAAVRAMYLPWLDATAAAFQRAVGSEGWAAPDPLHWGPGTCVLFSDGLRFDVAQRLVELLRGEGLGVAVETRRGALPGVTETGKPALMPIADKLRPAAGFDVGLAGSTSPKASADALRTAMERNGIVIVPADGPGDPSLPGWTECGEVDHRGHDARWALGCELDGLLRKIAHRVRGLLASGWTEVRVVTDHGWLLVPGDLPKPPQGLPEHLTEVRKGRCARMKPASTTSEQTVPWHFDSTVRVAVAGGASCYEAGKTYEHGGLSPQECILPVLVVRAGAGATTGVSIAKARWRGLRVTAEVEGAPEGARLDVRQQPGDTRSWLASGPQPIAPDGHATGLVQDDANLEAKAYVVVVSAGGTVLDQRETTVGAR